MTQVKTLMVGRNGQNNQQNEDLVLVYKNEHMTVMAAIDGITCLTPWLGEVIVDNTAVKVTSGWIAARVVAKNLLHLEDGMSFGDLLEHIVKDWNFARSVHDVPGDEILGAVFCAYVQLAEQPAELWQLGDCGWGVMTGGDSPEWFDSLDGVMAENSSDADLRAETILTELAKVGGVYPDNLLDNPDVLAELASMGFKVMREKRKARRTQDYAWLTDVNAMLAHRHVKEPVTVPEGITKLVLTTDGTLIVPQSIEEGLAFLADLREQDPLMVGLNKLGLRTAKGFVDMVTGEIRPYTDDLGIIEVTF